MTETDASTLFSTPYWTTETDPTTWWITELATDITEMLTVDQLGFHRTSGNQTLAVLQDRTEPHWLEFLGWVGATFEQIIGGTPLPHNGCAIRAWALRIDAQSAAKDVAAGPTRTITTHNHSPALLSSIFTCELPDEPAPDALATIFHNPVFHVNCPWLPRLRPVPPKVGKLVVFPGWVEHSVPTTAPLPPGQRRITINADYMPDCA
ncbi:hypothetical protein [Nocardia salmonicida]|uniref:hypothetical protein n=1 Tax=Nocardia salmonicida TaxID=53431 RepID=UPI0033DFBD13